MADGAGARCASPSDACGDCACGSACVDGACVETIPAGFAIACGGTCPGSQLCAATPTGFTCVDESTECADGCSETQTCVSLDGAATCITPTEPDGLDGLSDGVGLFVDLELDGSTANLVYFDAARGQLRGAQATTDGFATTLLACDPSMAVGFHPDLSLNAGGIAVSYQGLGGETLRILRGTDLLDAGLGGFSDSLVDDGVRDGALNLVGAYPTSGSRPMDAHSSSMQIRPPTTCSSRSTKAMALMSYGRSSRQEHMVHSPRWRSMAQQLGLALISETRMTQLEAAT